MVEISRLRRMASLLGSESTFASANSEGTSSINDLRQRVSTLWVDMTGSLMKSNVGIAQSWTSTSLTIPPELPNSNKELDEEALLLIQLSRLEFWIDEQRLILISFFGGIGVLILNMLVSIPFGWYAKFNENFGCTWGDHYYMNLAVVGLYVFVGLPFCIYIMRDSADAYFLSRSIWLILMVSPPLYLTFIGLSFADPTVEINHIFPAYNVGIISLIINHTGTIVIPLLNDMFKMQTEQEKLASYSGFVHTLGKDMLYDQLKDCIMEAFSAENGMFWDSFVSWMTRCLHQFFGASDKVHRDAMTMLLTANAFQDSDVLKSEVIKSSSQFIQFLASNQKVVTVKGISAIEVPMPYSVAKGLCLIYQRFLKEEAPFELNLPKATRDAISPTLLVLEEAVADLENQLEAAPNSRHQKSKAVLAGVLLSFIPMAPDDLPKLDRNELIVPITILDDVKIAVLAMIYQNSYPRYLKKQATSHV